MFVHKFYIIYPFSILYSEKDKNKKIKVHAEQNSKGINDFVNRDIDEQWSKKRVDYYIIDCIYCEKGKFSNLTAHN